MTRALLIALFIGLVAFPAAASEELANDSVAVPEDIADEIYFNLEFARAGDQSLYLDLYLPDGPGPYPLIISVHGGSWSTGDRNNGLAVLQVSRGYAVANIDYRLAPASTYPAQIEDCKAAVRWLRANAARFRLNPNAFAVMGYSAGGHLAALVGTTSGVEELEGAYLGNAAVSSRVQAVVDYFGPTDLLKLAQQALPCVPGDPNAADEAPSQLIGCPIQTCKEKTQKANPINYVTADDPPFLILHGTADCLVPWQQSQLLHDALKRMNVPSKLVLIPLAGHADPIFLLPSFQDKVNEFLDQHLKKPRRRRAVRH